MEKNSFIPEIIEMIADYNRHIFRSGKEQRDYGTGHLLHQDQIHLIVAVGKHAGCNLRTLAEMIGSSVPAISLQIDRLKKIGLVTKRRSEFSQRELEIDLTEEGRKAFEFHEQLDSEFYERAAAFLADCSEEEQRSIFTFISQMEKIVEPGYMPPM